METGGVLTCQTRAGYHAMSGCISFMGKTRKNMGAKLETSHFSEVAQTYSSVSNLEINELMN